MRNIALRLSYIGTKYHGWQTQRGAISIQQTLLQSINRICSDVKHVTGCGRTDAGVHAMKYCANFFTDSTIPFGRLPLALNSQLPDDISVSAACETEPGFNAILSCVKKEYRYIVIESRIRDPFYSDRAFLYGRELNLAAMKAAAEQFIGRHDFAAVRNVGTNTKTTVRTVFSITIERQGNMVYIDICADGFLYNMARAIAGTLIYVSEGKIAESDIGALLLSRDRRQTGPTLPPQGLYLRRLWYDGIVGEMIND